MSSCSAIILESCLINKKRWVTLRHNKLQTASNCETHIPYDVCYPESAQLDVCTNSSDVFCALTSLEILSLFDVVIGITYLESLLYQKGQGIATAFGSISCCSRLNVLFGALSPESNFVTVGIDNFRRCPTHFSKIFSRTKVIEIGNWFKDVGESPFVHNQVSFRVYLASAAYFYLFPAIILKVFDGGFFYRMRVAN